MRASIRLVRYFSMITFTPLRVVKPSLPAVIGMVRASLPLIVTAIVCFLTSTLVTTDLPIAKSICRLAEPQTPPPAFTPWVAMFTVILVPAGQ